MALARSDLLLAWDRARPVSLLYGAATVAAIAGLWLWAPAGADAPTLARLVGPDSLATKTLPLGAFAAMFVPAAAAAARRRSFDGPVVLLGGASETQGHVGLLGGTLDLSLRGGPIGTGLSGVRPPWDSLSAPAALGVTAGLLVAVAVVAVVADRAVPTPYSPG